MGKKKTTAQDFLNLLDDQEAAPTKRMFEPPKVKPAKKSAKKALLKIGTYQLSPVQDELVRFVLTRTPVISKLATPEDVAQRLSEALTEVHAQVQRFSKR